MKKEIKDTREMTRTSLVLPKELMEYLHYQKIKSGIGIHKLITNLVDNHRKKGMKNAKKHETT